MGYSQTTGTSLAQALGSRRWQEFNASREGIPREVGDEHSVSPALEGKIHRLVLHGFIRDAAAGFNTRCPWQSVHHYYFFSLPCSLTCLSWVQLINKLLASKSSHWSLLLRETKLWQLSLSTPGFNPKDKSIFDEKKIFSPCLFFWCME